MVTLALAHPVYAAQEDAYQRDTQAESEAGAYFERYLRTLLPDESSAEPPTLSDEIIAGLEIMFVEGWNAAREEQNR